MNKIYYCNYAEKAKWARKWNNAKTKRIVTKNFCKSFPNKFPVHTWYGRTTARNTLVRWAKRYNEGTLEIKKWRGNWVPKKKISILDVDDQDKVVYQEIVESILKDHNISKDEIAKRIIEHKKKTKNQKKMSGLFGFSNKIYYKVINKESTRIPKNRESLKSLILQFKKGFNTNYGYEKTREEMIRDGLINPSITIWDVRIACNELGIISSRIGRLSKKPKEKKDTLNLKPNLIKVKAIKRPNQVWSTDVSYIRVKAGFVYLSAVIDLYSLKIIGFKVSGSNDTNLVMESLSMALKYQKPPQIIHSDNGYQYTSKRYIKFTNDLNIKISKSAPGKSLENREIEFWFGLLKRENLYKLNLFSKNDANYEIERYTSWYNKKRIQRNKISNMSWIVPDEVHANYSH